MNYTYELTRLLRFLREVHHDFKLNRPDSAGPLVLSKSLISIALDDLADADIDALLESLEVERYILHNRNGQLMFPASFIERDSWINNYANYNA